MLLSRIIHESYIDTFKVCNYSLIYLSVNQSLRLIYNIYFIRDTLCIIHVIVHCSLIENLISSSFLFLKDH